MNYAIDISMFDTAWFDKIVAETLKIYNNKGDITNSPYVIYGREAAATQTGHADYVGISNIEEAVQNRQNKLLELYHSLKAIGYNGSVLLVWFDDRGKLKLYDGYHRVAVMRYLGMQIKLNVETEWYGLRGAKGKDFPLVSTLLQTHPKGEYLYQPVSDSRVSSWKIDRTDSDKRLERILGELQGETVLDIGCAEGFFSRGIARQGYKVTAIDTDPKFVAVNSYLSALESLKVNTITDSWITHFSRDVIYDNVLFLSVLHNTMKFVPIRESLDNLKKLRGKCSRLFLEVPGNENERDWKPSQYDFHSLDSLIELEELTGMKRTKVIGGQRKIFVMEATNKYTQGISNEQWEKENKWEQTWHGDCRNTFDEQLKQDMYAKYMKLDQFAIRRKSFDLKGRSVIDIGGGPCSLLLRCWNFSNAAIVDPCQFPAWVYARYQSIGIQSYLTKAEEMEFPRKFDEAWIYNCLQHVESPEKIAANVQKWAKKVRIFEPLNWGTCPGHPHNLTEEYLNKIFNRKGLVDEDPTRKGYQVYFGVFNYE